MTKLIKGIISQISLSVFVLSLSMMMSFIPEATSSEYNMKELVVTANKMEENLQDIPATITVIDSDMLKERGIKNLNDLMKQIPNLYSERTIHSSNEMNFRGLQSSFFTRNNPVVLYVDGIPQSNSYGYEASLVNVERVEVLRGSQGTMYGKDAIGGVINIITKKPGSMQGFVGAEYATNNYMQGTFALHAPIIKDNLYVTINGQLSKDEGWITNHHPGMDADADAEKGHNIGSTISYKPTDKLNIIFHVANEYFKNNWFDGLYFDPSKDIHSAGRDFAEHADYEVDTFTKIKGNSQALNVTYRFSGMNFSSVTTHKKLDLDSNVDYDFGNDPMHDGCAMFQEASFDTISQELRFSSHNHGGIRWVGGLYAEREKNENPSFGMTFNMPSGMNAMYTASDMSTDTAAVFAQAIIPFAGKFELTLGGRYQHLERDLDANTYFHPVGVTSDSSIYSLDAKHSWDVFLPKLAILYKVDNTISTFFNISKGYMPGGYNLFISSNEEKNSRFEPQTSINYEIGAKKILNKGYLDLTFFYLDIKDVHAAKLIEGDIPITSNIPEAHSYGAEVEFGYFFNGSWSMDGALGLLETEYDEHLYPILNGNRLQNSPSYTARLGISYNHPKGFYGRLEAKSRGDMTFNDEETLKENSYILADIRAGYKLKNWDFYCYIKNLADKEYIYQARQGEIKNHIMFGPSRTIGAGIKYSW